MKKILVSILLCLISLSTIIFTGCGDVEKRKIANFYSAYLAIADNSQNLTTSAIPAKFNSINSKKCVNFVYSDTLLSAMSESPYKEIDLLYNNLLHDVMGPTYLYSSALIEAKISKKERVSLFKKLDEVGAGYINVAQRVGDLERILEENTTDKEISLVALENLYSSYEGLLDSATKLSKQIYYIYFNRVMKDANPDYSSKNDASINLNDLAISTLNKKVYYLSVYADIYLHLEIIGKNAPTLIVNKNFNLGYLPYDSLSQKSYSGSCKANIETNRTEIIKNARALQLLQNDFEKKYTEYQESISKITYNQISSSSTPKEQGYKDIVDGFTSSTGIVYTSYTLLTNILDLCFEQI